MSIADHGWFIELYVLELSTTDDFTIIYGYAQPSHREARPWHGEPVSDCSGLMVLRANLLGADYQRFEEQLAVAGPMQLGIAKPKARSINVVNVGLVQRPPVLLRGGRLGLDGYELSPADGPAWCSEFWNLDKKGFLKTVTSPAQGRLEHYARFREIASAVARATGVPVEGDAARRLGNFDRVEPICESETDEVVSWEPAKETADLKEANGIEVRLPVAGSASRAASTYCWSCLKVGSSSTIRAFRERRRHGSRRRSMSRHSWPLTGKQCRWPMRDPCMPASFT